LFFFIKEGKIVGCDTILPHAKNKHIKKKEKKFKFAIPISAIRGAEKGVPCSGAATLVVSLWSFDDQEPKQIPTKEVDE